MNDGSLVYIVDDDENFRVSLKMLLESVGIDVRTFPSVDAFLAGYEPLPQTPSCLLLDVRMPGHSGLALLERLGKENDRLPVIMITGYGDIPMTVRAMKLGAVDFITKPFNYQKLLDLVQETLRQSTLRQQADAWSIDPQTARARWNTLTPREQQICEMIATGSPNKTIGYELGISVRTVESHRARIMEKLQARSVVDLVQVSLSQKKSI